MKRWFLATILLANPAMAQVPLEQQVDHGLSEITGIAANWRAALIQQSNTITALQERNATLTAQVAALVKERDALKADATKKAPPAKE